VSPVSARAVYAGLVEHSVYVDPAAQGRDAGQALLDTLIASSEAAGIWTIQSGVFPENTASRRLHQHAGFRTVVHDEQHTSPSQHPGECRSCRGRIGQCWPVDGDDAGQVVQAVGDLRLARLLANRRPEDPVREVRKILAGLITDPASNGTRDVPGGHSIAIV